jgi:hypothetical protein
MIVVPSWTGADVTTPTDSREIAEQLAAAERRIAARHLRDHRPARRNLRHRHVRDDDYSHRARLAGLRVICAEDVFVQHYGQASFSKLTPQTYDELWKRNQAYFEKKWDVRWKPHKTR